MSEYIVQVPDEQAEQFIARFGIEDTRIFGFQLTGEIVRCGDCKWAKPEQSDHEYRGEYHCNMWIADVSADGFCFRAKRRDAE